MVKIGYQCFYYLSTVPCMNLIAHISVGYQVYARKFIESLSGSNLFFFWPFLIRLKVFVIQLILAVGLHAYVCHQCVFG